MLDAVTNAATDALRRAALLFAGLLCLAVGGGFLTAAVWWALVPVWGPAATAAALACVYAILAAIALALGARRPPMRQPARPPMTQAFMTGLQAGLSTARRTRN